MTKTLTSLACGLAAAATLAACPVPAGAAVTSVVTGGTLTITDDEITGAPLVVTCQNAEVRVNGAATGAACDAIELIVVDSAPAGNGYTNTIDLTAADAAGGFTRLTENRVTAGIEDTVRGGAGRDVIRSSQQVAAVEAGGGADEIDVNGASALDAGPGDDLVRSWNPNGSMLEATGGEGTDTFLLDGTGFPTTPLEFVLDDDVIAVASERWRLRSLETLDVRMPGGPQTVDATNFSGPVRIDGGAGDDRLRGGAAADVLVGGPGVDTIAARDGVPDRVDCGADAGDSLVADRTDLIDGGCELVDLPPLPEPEPEPEPVGDPAPDTAAPAVRVARAALRGRRLRVVLACPAGESLCLGTAALRGPGRQGVRLGALPIAIAGGTSHTLARRLSRGQRRRLARARRIAVRLDVRDAAGNRLRLTARVPLARGRR